MSKRSALILACVLAAALALPFVAGLYWLRVATSILLFATLAQGINIITGFTGYAAFGNVVFFGLGAYATAIVMNAGYGFLPGLAAGVGMCVAFTAAFGVPLLRLTGHYFAIATLGLNEATKAIVNNLTDVTGGGKGLSLALPPGTVFESGRMFYFLFLGLTATTVTVVWTMGRTRFGFACRAIRLDEDAAAGAGIDTTRHKTLAWMTSAALTGLAGGIYAWWFSYIDPPSVFDMGISVKAFVIFLLGGAGTLWGPVVAAIGFELLSTFVWSNFLNYHLGTLGLFVMLIVLFAPRGLGDLLQRSLRRPRATPVS